MVGVPFLVLFFVSLAFHLIKSGDIKLRINFSKAGFVIGALCGVYTVFMLWLAVGGFGDSIDYNYVVTVNGMTSYFGQSSIFPLVIFAFILIPLLTYAPAGVARLITPFIEEPGYIDMDKVFYSVALPLIIPFYISIIPLILIFDELQYYDSFLQYLVGGICSILNLRFAVGYLFAGYS